MTKSDTDQNLTLLMLFKFCFNSSLYKHSQTHKVVQKQRSGTIVIQRHTTSNQPQEVHQIQEFTQQHPLTWRMVQKET